MKKLLSTTLLTVILGANSLNAQEQKNQISINPANLAFGTFQV